MTWPQANGKKKHTHTKKNLSLLSRSPLTWQILDSVRASLTTELGVCPQEEEGRKQSCSHTWMLIWLFALVVNENEREFQPSINSYSKESSNLDPLSSPCKMYPHMLLYSYFVVSSISWALCFLACLHDMTTSKASILIAWSFVKYIQM